MPRSAKSVVTAEGGVVLRKTCGKPPRLRRLRYCAKLT